MQARFAMEFCAIESCGKCTPCRIGSTRGVEVIDKIRAGIERERNLQLLDDLCTVMTDGSLCAMGGLTPCRCAAQSGISPKTFCGLCMPPQRNERVHDPCQGNRFRNTGCPKAPRW